MKILMKSYNICNKCFLDPYISKKIEDNGKEGICCVCNNNKPHVMDILSLEDLNIFFDIIFDTINIIYNKDVTDKNTEDFLTLLKKFYFIDINKDKEYLIKYYVDKNYPDCYNSFLIQSSEILKKLKEKENIWYELLEEVKHERRFIFKESTDKLIFEMQKYSSIFLESIKKETILYRGRIGNHIDKENFLKPPRDKSQHSRANPYGISHLYLANDKDCCINECRLSYPNSISIAEFHLLKDIFLLDLTKKPSIIRMCQLVTDTEDFETNKNIFSVLEVFSHIDEEMSRPVYDEKKHLDYILTQLFTECFKFTHEKIESEPIDGIIFRSSFDFNGENEWKNYVLFNDKDILNCKNIEYYSWVYKNQHYKLDLFNTVAFN